jgi:hypothetical protein
MATTKWHFDLNTNQPAAPEATLKVTGPSGTAVPIRLKGVCYSPTPIGASGDYAPNIGDFFWDTFDVPLPNKFTVRGWYALWERDLERIRRLGMNCIRIYSCLSHHLSDGGPELDPKSPDFKGRFRSHKAFLDQCWNHGNNPLYVLVGLPLPSCMLWEEEYQDRANDVRVKFWNFVYKETAQQLGDHPAVMGFTLFNERADGEHSILKWDNPKNPKTVVNSDKVKFFWSQVQELATQVKSVAPGKLVGFGLHDNPDFTSNNCTQFLAGLRNIDFYGVNTYQPQNMDPVFGRTEDENKNVRLGYRNLTGGALKPVIISEWGMPATTRGSPADSGTITDSPDSIQKTADTINTVVPKIFAEKLCLGLFYFEYCDEWWKQPIRYATIKAIAQQNPSYAGWIDRIPLDQRSDDKAFGSIYRQCGGPYVGGSLSNGYQDEAGFGLYSVQRGPGVPMINTPYGPPTGSSIGPATTIDKHTERVKMTEALRQCYAAVKP